MKRWLTVCLALSFAPAHAAGQDSARRELVVRVLDVGQGDATLITNGGSRVLIDGGPSVERFGRLLDSLGLNNSIIDVVILSHPHLDHYSGLRALFDPARRIRVRFFIEARDPSTSSTLAALRATVIARARRGQLEYRDADDPCGDGRPLCTIELRGGAKIHVMRPYPSGGGRSANDRSVPVKVVGADSASFTMWLAGDAERDAIGWFLSDAGYATVPGMRVTVLKGDHHGSCNGITQAYAAALSPELVTLSVGARNAFGHVHAQTEALWRERRTTWLRTDENGTITLRSSGKPHDRYIVNVQKGRATMLGPADAPSAQSQCNPIP